MTRLNDYTPQQINFFVSAARILSPDATREQILEEFKRQMNRAQYNREIDHEWNEGAI